MNNSMKIALFVIDALLSTVACTTIIGDEEDRAKLEETEEINAQGPAESTDAEISSSASTYYVRPDGGSADQCNGTTDAPYPGRGSDVACAWDHPFRALAPGRSSRISGGDTLIIAAGSYMMGLGAPGSDACEADYPWDCFMTAIPSGVPGLPTRILGGGWDHGCLNPPELWGTERAYRVLNLEGSSHVEVACLEVTDHLGCAEFHSGDWACERDSFPYGDWAETGLFATDSSDVYLNDLDIHGLATHGVLAGRLNDWTVEDVRIAANGWVGWDGDVEGEDANSGSLIFRRWIVEWNGCVESYPGNEPVGCWAQSAGGYGDGVGTGETGGRWVIEDSAFLHNTSDGLDLLYARLEGSDITIRRTTATGNAGDQIKTTGPTHIENVVAVSSCGYFDGKPFTYNVDHCRAGGSAIALNPRSGDRLSVVNSTITGQGDCLIIAECGSASGCSGSETVLVRNSILLGNPEFRGGGDLTCLAWWGLDTDPFVFDHDIIAGLKAMPSICPDGSLCDIDPGLMSSEIDDFDARLTTESPAVDAGTSEMAPADDIAGRPRDEKVDIGAYELAVFQ